MKCQEIPLGYADTNINCGDIQYSLSDCQEMRRQSQVAGCQAIIMPRPTNVPEVDMCTVSKSSAANRRAILGFVPRGLSIVDSDMERMDHFYLECQKYRDYYRDPYNKLHKPAGFANLGSQPVRWVEERQPVIYPTEYGSNMNLGVETRQTTMGRFGRNSCRCFKR